MSLFIIKYEQIDGNIIHFNAEDAYHLWQVLRKRAGDKIECMDQHEKKYSCIIDSISAKHAAAEIISEQSKQDSHQIPITLLFPLLKGKKTEWVLQKGTELAIHSFIPFLYKRTVVKPENDKKLLRFKKIIHEACKQCERGIEPDCEPIIDAQQLTNRLNNKDDESLRIVLWEEEHNTHLKELLVAHPTPKHIYLAVGPEGGIESKEIELLETLGFRIASLGNNILRSETACLAAISMVSYHFYKSN